MSGAVLVTKHVWVTVEGDLVPHGHRDARFLKYPPGEQLTDAEAKDVPAECLEQPKRARRKAGG